MFERLVCLREYFSLLSKKAITKWILVLAGVSGYFFFTSGSFGPSYFDALYTIAASLGWLIATGLPFVLGASMIICSDETRNNIAQKLKREGEVRFFPLILTYILLMISSIAIVSLAGLVIAAFASGSIVMLQFLPQFLCLSILVTLLISPVYLLLVLALDSTKLSLIISLVLSFTIIIATGFPRYPVYPPEIALLEPAHLFSALLFIMIGAYGQYAVEYYVGTLFQPVHLVLPIIILIVLLILGYYGSNKLFVDNLPRWLLEWDEWLIRDQSFSESDKSNRHDQLLKARQSLTTRRKRVAAFAIAVMIVIPLTSMSYTQAQLQEWTQIVYESPSGGETVNIGDWIFGSFAGVEPPPSISLSVGCSGLVLDWAGGPGYIEYTFEHRAMTLVEFQALNETEFDDLFGHSSSANYGTIGSFGGGWSGPISDLEYVWVLKFIDVNGLTSGSLNVWFQIIISAI